MNSFIISNVSIVTTFSILENGFVYVKKGAIEAIGQTSPGRVHRSCNIIDGHGSWLLPGIIDLYNNSFEKAYGLSTKTQCSVDSAFFSIENTLAEHGITTVYHHISETNIEALSTLTRLKKLGIMRHNSISALNLNGNYNILNASGIIEEAATSVNINLSDIPDSNYLYIVCSDDAAKTIIQSIFTLHHALGISLVDAVKIATINPAKALGIDKKYGSIEYGKNADMILVSCENDIPAINKVFVCGCKIYEKQTYVNGNAV